MKEKFSEGENDSKKTATIVVTEISISSRRGGGINAS